VVAYADVEAVRALPWWESARRRRGGGGGIGRSCRSLCCRWRVACAGGSLVLLVVLDVSIPFLVIERSRGAVAHALNVLPVLQGFDGRWDWHLWVVDVEGEDIWAVAPLVVVHLDPAVCHPARQ